MNEYGALVERYWQGKVEALQENYLPNVLNSQFSHAVAKNWTQISKGAIDIFNIALAQAIRTDAIGAFLYISRETKLYTINSNWSAGDLFLEQACFQ
jgi:hypothetical protein